MSRLIVWPQPEGKFTDTGEGGMHALALFPFPDDEHPVETSAYTTLPNVIVSLSNSGTEQGDIFKNYKLVNENTTLEEVISVPFCAVVVLGSTQHALWDSTSNTYFGITSGSLSEKGEAFVRILSEAYGTEPIFMTCLDT